MKWSKCSTKHCTHHLPQKVLKEELLYIDTYKHCSLHPSLPLLLTFTQPTDPTRILAEPQQFGLLHSNTSLSCTTTFDVDPAFIFISWERNCTPTSNQITDVRLTHEGQYVCEVILGHLNGLIMKKNVTFYVIGECIGVKAMLS